MSFLDWLPQLSRAIRVAGVALVTGALGAQALGARATAVSESSGAAVATAADAAGTAVCVARKSGGDGLPPITARIDARPRGDAVRFELGSNGIVRMVGTAGPRAERIGQLSPEQVVRVRELIAHLECTPNAPYPPGAPRVELAIEGMFESHRFVDHDDVAAIIEILTTAARQGQPDPLDIVPLGIRTGIENGWARVAGVEQGGKVVVVEFLDPTTHAVRRVERYEVGHLVPWDEPSPPAPAAAPPAPRSGFLQRLGRT